MYKFDDTIVAAATRPGSGAISIVRLSGARAIEIAEKILSLKSKKLSECAANTVHYATIFLDDNSVLDEVLVSLFKSPYSYTGEDSVEISTHSSIYIVQTLISMLIDKGARLAEAGEFTQRAFINGKMDLAQAESVADLIASSSRTAHKVAMSQLRGEYSNELKDLRAKLLNMTSLVELELDFSEEDVEFADRTALKKLLEDCISHIASLSKSFKLGNAISKGIPVAIVGPANAGKSSLLNALIKEDRAIVSNIAGTTRDSIEELMNIDGILYKFIDTAGIRESEDEIERIGISRSYKKMKQAQLVLAVFDISQDALIQNIRDIVSNVDAEEQSLFVLLNKIDLLSESELAAKVQNLKTLFPDINIISMTVHDNTHIELLTGQIAQLFNNQLGGFEHSLVTNQRHYTALIEALAYLKDISIGIENNVYTELLAEDLRQAISKLSSILGEIDNDEILGNIFKNFCIGK